MRLSGNWFDRSRLHMGWIECLARCNVARASVVLASLMLSACTSTISRTELQSQLSAEPAPLILDVRSAREYRDGHIPGAQHIPFSELRSRADALPRKPVVVYCEHGPRAVYAGIVLHHAGFDTIYSLSGHMSGWRRAGLPVER